MNCKHVWSFLTILIVSLLFSFLSPFFIPYTFHSNFCFLFLLYYLSPSLFLLYYLSPSLFLLFSLSLSLPFLLSLSLSLFSLSLFLFLPVILRVVSVVFIYGILITGLLESSSSRKPVTPRRSKAAGTRFTSLRS